MCFFLVSVRKCVLMSENFQSFLLGKLKTTFLVFFASWKKKPVMFKCSWKQSVNVEWDCISYQRKIQHWLIIVAQTRIKVCFRLPERAGPLRSYCWLQHISKNVGVTNRLSSSKYFICTSTLTSNPFRFDKRVVKLQTTDNDVFHGVSADTAHLPARQSWGFTRASIITLSEYICGYHGKLTVQI